jgi:N5-(cytidine 5'-diphosphoramidyl)-L-glutamine hydrolase
VSPHFVAVTQRAVRVPERAELGDYLDGRWAATLAAQGLTVLPLPNHLPAMTDILIEVPVRLLVLSGGNDLAGLPGARDAHPHRDAAECAAIGVASRNGIPVLGVCRGAQLLLARLGVQPARQAGHGGTVHDVRTTSIPPWDWPARFQVTSHHDWVLRREMLPRSIEVIAEADDGTVEAFCHLAEEQWGIMWHPEREDPDGPALRALRAIAGLA